MADDDRSGDDSKSGDGEKVATAGHSAASSTAGSAASGAPPEQVATNAASGGADVAEAAGGDEAAAAMRTASSTAAAGQSIAQATQSGDPASAIGAAGSAAGMAGAVAGVAGDSKTAQTVSQVASVAQQTAGVAQQTASVAQSVSQSADSPSAPGGGGGGGGGLIQDVGSMVSEVFGGGGGEQIQVARFEFSLPKGPDIQWYVRRFSISSEISRIYEMHVELVCEDVAAPIDEMLGATCELLIERGDLLHTYYGIIDEIDDVGPDQTRLHASVRVIPAFGMLAEQIDTRIFQGQTVIEILTDVLSKALKVYKRALDTSTFVKREYNARDYCTQFRESTFEFCCRLMEEEGIAFIFVPDEDNHCEKLVLIDNNNDYPEVELANQEEVPIIGNNADEADRESVRNALWRQRRHINKVVGRAYNFKAADSYDEIDVFLEETHNHHEQALYLHDRRRQITDDPVGDQAAEEFTGEDLNQREQLATQVLEEHLSHTKTVSGRGNVTGFGAGTRFTLGSHHRGDLDGAELLIVHVNHSGAADPFGNDGAGQGGGYSNDFSAIPFAHEYRPPQRHRRAKVYGPQLARVVGVADSDDEIHTDKFGRIKVQFHHERLALRDAGASVWMRVVQPWAGPQWGTMFIPRVGMEVVVQFVDGNPDNPVVTGSVYNSENMPPFTLPDEKTKSTIKTSSSIGGDGFNELSFEDAAGQEQIIVHAQKDFNKKVLNNQSRSVGANDSTSVGGNQSLSVTGDRTHAIEGNETLTITGSQKISITGASAGDGQDVTGGQLDITGKYKLDASESIEVQAPDYIQFKVGSTFIKMEPSKITLQQEDGSRVVLSPDSALMASKENSQVKLTADAQMQASTGGDVTLTADAQMTGQEAQVKLDGECLMKSAGGAEVKLDADAKVFGANATMDATTASTVSAGTSSTLTAAGSTVKTSGAAAEMSGPQANVAGSGAVNITGGIIKLN